MVKKNILKRQTMNGLRYHNILDTRAGSRRHLGYKRITHLLKGNASAASLMKVGAAKTQRRPECVAARSETRTGDKNTSAERTSPPRHFFFNQFNQRTPSDWLLTDEF